MWYLTCLSGEPRKVKCHPKDRMAGMRGLVCPCMHLLSGWPLSLQLANALVKQSAETIDHCMWQRQGVCGGRTRGEGRGGVRMVGERKKKYEAFSGRGRAKVWGEKEGWGEGDRLKKEGGHVKERGRARERERERERWYWVEVDAGQWRCRWPINLGLFLPSYCVFLLARDWL